MITITEAIAALRRDLSTAVAAARDADDEGVRLSVEDVVVQLEVTLTTQQQAGAEVNVWVLKVGGQVQEAQGTSHTVSLTLKPSGPSGPLDVASAGKLPEAPRARD